MTDQELQNQQLALEWIMISNAVGESSKTIWGHFMGQEKRVKSYPHDPSDFRRCANLFQLIPDWKKRMDELRVLSPIWNNLVENWEKLELLLIENIKTGKDNGMYDFMQELIKDGLAK